jgi:hypothetical protein
MLIECAAVGEMMRATAEGRVGRRGGGTAAMQAERGHLLHGATGTPRYELSSLHAAA